MLSMMVCYSVIGEITVGKISTPRIRIYCLGQSSGLLSLKVAWLLCCWRMDPGEIPEYVSFDSLRLRFLWVALVVDNLTSVTSGHAARGKPIDVVELSKHVSLVNWVLESAIFKESLLLSALVILESRERMKLLRSLISLFISFSKYAYLSSSLNISRSNFFTIISSRVDWEVLTPSGFAL